MQGGEPTDHEIFAQDESEQAQDDSERAQQ
jgi:hypothetical protein